MKQLFEALNAFQAEVVTVAKSADNPFFHSKYASLDAIMKQAQPVLAKHGLAVIQLPTHIDGVPALRTVVAHVSGESIEDVAPLALLKNDPQSQGSAITYMRRYAYAAALGIVIDEDDDANGAIRPMTRSKPTAPDPDNDPWASPPPVAEVHAHGASSAQIQLIQTLMGKAGYGRNSEKYDRMSIILDKTVNSSRELTKREASLVIEALQVEVNDKPAT